MLATSQEDAKVAFFPSWRGITLPRGTAGGNPVRRLIDTGGMGKVWQAEDTVLDRAVAIKVIRPDLRHDPKFADSFLSEAKNVARLDHPNIVKVYSAGKHEGDLYLVMEFVDGVTLRQINYPNPKALCTVFRQLLVAIRYAHRQGIIHRDIKSSNVMVSAEGNAKILDFGISRNESSDLKHTMTGAVIGTIPYLSPELATGSGRSSVQSDIYALGVVLYELATGSNPYEGQSPLQMLEKVKNEPLRTDGAELASFSTAFRSFLQRMVAHDLSERYENLDEALRDFDRLPETNSDELEAQATVPWSEALPSEGKEKSESPNPSDTGRSGRSGRWIFGIAALLVVLGLVYYFVFSGTAREDETLFYTWLEIPATQLADGELIRVAILPTRNETGQSELDEWAERSTDRLLASLVYRITPSRIEIERTQRFIAGRDMASSSGLDPFLATVLGKEGVDVLLAGTLTARGDEGHSIQVRLLSTGNGSVLADETRPIERVETLSETVDTMVETITEKF